MCVCCVCGRKGGIEREREGQRGTERGIEKLESQKARCGTSILSRNSQTLKTCIRISNPSPLRKTPKTHRPSIWIQALRWLRDVDMLKIENLQANLSPKPRFQTRSPSGEKFGYIYIYRERERKRGRTRGTCCESTLRFSAGPFFFMSNKGKLEFPRWGCPSASRNFSLPLKLGKLRFWPSFASAAGEVNYM